ncbi:KTR1 [Brettanomyces bruxellensis]|uniref:DEBR0S2_10154g1_1 n=1 Tax=Dekkera bruxellensis TaxID=5007 RepID=A0A7D9CWN3_DEKBR|nr:KTR1 [Brettanomyces bruxellensis]
MLFSNLGFYSKGIEFKAPEYYNDVTQNKVKRENATLFSLVRNSELDGMLSSIKYVEERFNNRFHYDWVFMNDKPFTEYFKGNVSAAVSGRAIFSEIPKEFWDIPDSIDKDEMKKDMDFMAREQVLYARKVTYRQMCRFNSGFFYKMPVMNTYQYYWRVEPFIRFYCDIAEDPFKIMREEKRAYGFTMAMLEDRKTIRQLWSNTLEFFESEHPEYVGKRNSIKFITHDSETHTFEPRNYNLCHYWSNFEIADLNFFRSKEYEDYFQYLDATGNFFYERWGDAPIHSLAVSYLLPFEKIHYFANTGYYHKPNFDCPSDPDIFNALHCKCEPARSFTNLAYSCVPRFLLAEKADLEENTKV